MNAGGLLTRVLNRFDRVEEDADVKRRMDTVMAQEGQITRAEAR